MPFRFTLAPLLRLRQSLERQRTLQLQKTNLDVSRAEEGSTQLDHYLFSAEQSDAKGLSAGCSAADLQFACLLRENFLRYRGELQSDLRGLEVLRQKALADYHQAFRDREALESLRVRQRRLYDQEQSRRQQQQQLDSDYLLQRWHRRT